MWSSVTSAGCRESYNVVVTTTQFVSVMLGYNVPPPVTRQDSATAQLTQALQELGAVWTAAPVLS